MAIGIGGKSHFWGIYEMTEAARRVPVLGILPGAEQETLRDILGSSDCHDLTCVRSPGFVRAALLSKKPRLIITCDRFDGGQTWKHVLAEVARCASKPQIIVCSRLADDRLWGEVLNHGAFDLLELPFRRNDVLYAISFALRVQAQDQIRPRLAASATDSCRIPSDLAEPVPFGLKLA